LPDLQVRKHNRIADRHSRQEIGIGLGAQEMNAARQVFRMLDEQIAHRSVDGDRDDRRGHAWICPRSLGDARVDIAGVE
jgi:hypothetical protein